MSGAAQPRPDPRVAARVAIASESAVLRAQIAQWLGDAPGLQLAGYAADADQVRRLLAHARPERLVLDLDMASLASPADLGRLLAGAPDLRVVLTVADASPRRGWPRPPAVGACLARPAPDDPAGLTLFRDALLKAVAPAAERADGRHRPAGAGVLIVAASTGGPQAIAEFLGALGPGWRTPVLIVQHMPQHLTGVFAAQLSKAGGRPVAEVNAPVRLTPGRGYLAPGDRHIRLAAHGADLWVEPDDGPEENWCRPSADPLLRSAAELPVDALAVILTGMGHDGLEGCRRLRAAGGHVLAQDEASSVVWGMPGAVASAGLADAVGPVVDLARAARARFLGEGR